MKGMTLVELLACVAILAVTASFGLPFFHSMIQRSESITAINWLVRSVVFARSAAVTYNTNVTLCPSRDGRHCGGHWASHTIVFTDANLDHIPDGKDLRLMQFDFPLNGGTITWHSFGNRQYLQMTGEGFTHYQNGNFIYCPENGDSRYAMQLVINMAGRARTSKDTNGDGYVEDRHGHHLHC